MGRFGELFDQDAEPSPARPEPRPGSARRRFYDQDEEPGAGAPAAAPPPGEPGGGARQSGAEARRAAAEARQRERLLELQRQAAWEEERAERRRRIRDAMRAAATPATPVTRRLPPGAPRAAPPQAPAPPATAPPARPTPAPPPSPVPPARERPPAPPTTIRPAPPATAPPARPTPAPPTTRPAPRATAPPTAAPPGSPAATVAAPAPAPRPGPPAHRARRPERAGTHSLGRATAILAAGTFASRITGFLRILAVAYVLGVGSLSDAYNYANGVPNIVYDLLLGGVLSATMIPVFVEQFTARDRREGLRAVSAVLTAIAAGLLVVTVALWVLAPWVMRFYLLLNHSSSGPAERALGSELLRYFAPQVFFLGAIVVTTALLNARRHFTAAAFSPVLNNLIAIAAILVTKFVASGILTAGTPAPTTLDRFRHDERAILILGLGTTAGYAVQFLIHLPAMRRAGIRVRPVWDLHHPAVRQVARLSSWLIGVVIANQVSLALVMVLAGRTDGGLSAYQFSYQFFQLPYALVAVSIASALMPDLAERWTRGDRRGFQRQFIVGLRVTLAVLTPAAAGYVAVAQPVVQLAIHHGRVTGSGAHLVSSSLALFAVGLPGFSAFFLLMRAYQALQAARPMFWLYALENGLSVVAAVVLEPLLGVPGLALAWVGPYTVVSIIAGLDLRRRVGTLGGAFTRRAITRIVVASLAMLGVVALVGRVLPSGGGDAAAVARLSAQVVTGTVTYLVLARLLGIREVRPVLRLARRLVGA